MAEAPKRVQGPAIGRCATHTIKTLVDKQIRNFWQSKLSGNIHCQLWNHLDYEEGRSRGRWLLLRPKVIISQNIYNFPLFTVLGAKNLDNCLETCKTRINYGKRKTRKSGGKNIFRAGLRTTENVILHSASTQKRRQSVIRR